MCRCIYIKANSSLSFVPIVGAICNLQLNLNPSKSSKFNTLPYPPSPLRTKRRAPAIPFAPHTELASMGIHIFRSETPCKLGAAVKGGSNGVPHCHHDLGHFNISVNGSELVSDIGIGVYTKGNLSGLPSVPKVKWASKCLHCR